MIEPLSPSGPLDVNEMLVIERDELVRLLSELDPADWAKPTECPAWDVKGVVLHIVGDDLSLLSRQRDAATNGLVLMAEELPGVSFRELLDAFNERWVHTAQFFGTDLIIDLLRRTGEWTAEFYRSVPPGESGEPVMFVGPDPAPYWMIAAREYAERWIHHCQVTRAIGRPVPDGTVFVVPAVAALVRGFPSAMAAIAAPPETTVTLQVDSVAWTLRREDTDWSLHDGAPAEPTVRIEVTRAEAAALFSRGLGAEQITALHADGDRELARNLLGGLALFFAQTGTPGRR
jgi:uncharacterized protein (TIGR03083 family)